MARKAQVTPDALKLTGWPVSGVVGDTVNAGLREDNAAANRDAQAGAASSPRSSVTVTVTLVGAGGAVRLTTVGTPVVWSRSIAKVQANVWMLWPVAALTHVAVNVAGWPTGGDARSSSSVTVGARPHCSTATGYDVDAPVPAAVGHRQRDYVRLAHRERMTDDTPTPMEPVRSQ